MSACLPAEEEALAELQAEISRCLPLMEVPAPRHNQLLSVHKAAEKAEAALQGLIEALQDQVGRQAGRQAGPAYLQQCGQPWRQRANIT